MRIRFTRPEFYRSERVASVNWEARYILKGLESYSDDNGVGKYNLALIASDVLPHDLARDASRTLASLHAAINALHEAGLLWLYTHEGTELMFLSFWEQVQRIDRPAKGRFPRPDGTLEYGESQIGANNTNDRAPSRAFTTKAGKQVSREADKQEYSFAQISDPIETQQEAQTQTRFDAFWAAYPNKRDKRKAENAFVKALQRAPVETIIQAATNYRNDPNREEQFTKYPATWLNNDCWNDPPLPPRKSGNDRIARDRDFWANEMAQAQAVDNADHRKEIGS